jgi:preprotein translocase subunit SecD
MHIAEEATGASTATVEYAGRQYTFRQPGLRVGVSATTYVQDALGFPALAVTIIQADEQRFSDWTAQHVDENLAVGVGDKVFSIASINERLGGSLTISLGDADPASVSAAKAAIEAYR